ncbi:MAG: hypothetical protein IPO07_01260 [Haliscomenobacter sp.]|nr:hypothetical protein [Haliscomenobacter sp.]MBK9487551.1 hypothetical protein [Haliscomenobacter sp.]
MQQSRQIGVDAGRIKKTEGIQFIVNALGQGGIIGGIGQKINDSFGMFAGEAEALEGFLLNGTDIASSEILIRQIAVGPELFDASASRFWQIGSPQPGIVITHSQVVIQSRQVQCRGKMELVFLARLAPIRPWLTVGQCSTVMGVCSPLNIFEHFWKCLFLIQLHRLVV